MNKLSGFFSKGIILLIFQLLYINSFSQCLEGPGVIYRSNNPFIKLDSVASLSAPMFWFSPDEPNLFDNNGEIQIPEPLPYDLTSDKPVVYYKINTVFTSQKDLSFIPGSSSEKRSTVLDLDKVLAFEIEYYCYYSVETGVGGHPHDFESVQFQIKVNQDNGCAEGKYTLEVKRIIARAHGLYWFENAMNVDASTKLPMSILVEEGKHANCTDKNADGVYTPGFDVTEKVNDAWGVRDIISTGRLFSGGFQGWMAKTRTANSLLLPPVYKNTPSFNAIKERSTENGFTNSYILRPIPEIPDTLGDKKLKKMVKSKKPLTWPTIKTSVSKSKNFYKLSHDNKLRNKLGFTFRFDNANNFSISVPLLLFKHVEAPMTGGWFYHKIYFGVNGDSTPDILDRVFGHQIQHSTSASRWLDTYIGIGYEYLDVDREPNSINHKMYLASELGIKVRVNITKTPLKILRFLGTDYWGVKVGWKNLGFNPFLSSGFVIEVGAGAF